MGGGAAPPGGGGRGAAAPPTLPPHLIRIALRHHERLDGSGYPHGLAGTAIDEPSLLCAIADVHTALTDRPPTATRSTTPPRFAHMRPFVGRQFKPALFQRYERVMRDGDGAVSRAARS